MGIRIRWLAAPWLAAACLGIMPFSSGADATFAEAIASPDRRQLTEWGRRYQHGEGIPRDLDKAIRLYCRAARKGDLAAQYYLGYLYANGSGVHRDEALAAAWLHLAAAKNDPQSKRILSRLGYSKRPKRRAACILSDGSDVEHPTVASADVKLTRGARIRAKGPIADLARKLSQDYGLDPDLVLAMIKVESNFDPRALSPKNAQGLMQLIPATAERFGVRDVWDPEQNLRGGMAYLRWLLREFDGDLRLVLAAYNAGEAAVERHGGIPPYPETRRYVARIMDMLTASAH